MGLPFAPEARWVLIGDSITDCGRRECAEKIGGGYVRMVRDYLRASRPGVAPEIINQGISGNKVTDLQARWDTDVLAHQPALVSIKIGINDVWHGLADPLKGTSVEQFAEGYEDILQRLKVAFPDVHIVLCEPSVIWPPSPEEGNDALQPYIAIVRDMAQRFKATSLVPLHAAFENARRERPDIVWAPDGVHPSSSGHMLIAREWLASLGLL
ncbi:SGNH/GDSL hydrolase family protein [soil metagenome]